MAHVQLVVPEDNRGKNDEIAESEPSKYNSLGVKLVPDIQDENVSRIDLPEQNGRTEIKYKHIVIEMFYELSH